MRNNMTFRLFGWMMTGFLKKNGVDGQKRKATLEEYRQILERAKPISSANMLSSYALAAFYIAMNRKVCSSPEESYQILSENVKNSGFMKTLLGSADAYLSEKKRVKLQAWSKQSHESKLDNDWVVDILPATKDYEMGYNYYNCGTCRLCQDEGCPELAQYLCKLDFILFDLMGIELKRTMTLAEGGEKCDFRFRRKHTEKQ